MKIVVASDSFKGSLSSLSVADAIEKGCQKVVSECSVIKFGISDGGEGLVESLVPNKNSWIYKNVLGPMGGAVNASYAFLDGTTAVIEMASASGLPLVTGDKNPLRASTYGTGQLMIDALNRGAKKLLIGIGGSATNDAGVGMALALGVSFLNKEGQHFTPEAGTLDQITSVLFDKIDPRIENCEILVACDVDNPLCGPNGASAIYGPQKGADSHMVHILDSNLKALSSLSSEFKKIALQKGSGAAGGLGFGLVAFCQGELKPGIDLVLEGIGFDHTLENASLVFTGEGMIDGQSLRGKVPVGVAARAKKQNIPVIALCGAVGEGIEKLYECGISSIFSIADKPMTLDESMRQAALLLEKSSEAILRAALLNLK